MKKVLFLCTHLGSCSQALYDVLESSSRIQGYKSKNPNVYNSNYNLITLMSMGHKLKISSSCIYMDELNYNFQLNDRNLSKKCKYVFFVRNPIDSIGEMVRFHGYKPFYAYRYYCFRLRRLSEMSIRLSDSLFLTYDDLCEGKGTDLIQEYLELRNPLKFEKDDIKKYQKKSNIDLLAPILRDQVSDCYERYLYFLRSRFRYQTR